MRSSRYGVPPELAEVRAESLLSPPAPGKAINAPGFGRRPGCVHQRSSAVSTRQDRSAVDFSLPPEEGECVEPLINADERCWRRDKRWCGSLGVPMRRHVEGRRDGVRYVFRQESASPLSRSCVLAWRSLRLCQRRSLGWGRRPPCDVRIFPGRMLICMKQIDIKKRLSVGRASFKFEVSSGKHEKPAASVLLFASYVRADVRLTITFCGTNPIGAV